jgi:hypothetical protein
MIDMSTWDRLEADVLDDLVLVLQPRFVIETGDYRL